MDIVTDRLHNHHLTGNPCRTIAEVVRSLGAIQAQDYASAAWAINLRTDQTSKADIDTAYNHGNILRTHVLRPTWHFVLPEDIRWMTQLTAPRINQILRYYAHKLALDDDTLKRCRHIIVQALEEGHFLTRTEIGDRLEQHGIPARGQRLGHIMMQAEIDGVICSGPMKGKQFTYALLEVRAPAAKTLEKAEALALLASRYFTSHGPATIHDFSWWSGLTITDAKLGLELTRKQLDCYEYQKREYWFKEYDGEKTPLPRIQLLSVYDEYIIGYQNYTPIFPEATTHLTRIFGNAQLNYIVLRNGIAVGSWRRTIKNNIMALIVDISDKIVLQTEEKELLAAEATRYARFFHAELGTIHGL